MKRPTALLAAALEYAKTGFQVLPLHAIADGCCTCMKGKRCSSPGKHPRTAHGLKDATLDPKVIRRWWHRWPNANVGITTGDGLLVLDVDPRHGGRKTLLALERRHGKLPEIARALTGGGGFHLLLRYPKELTITNSASKLGDGLDVRADGGYVVVEPSIHASGRPYRWKSGSPPSTRAVPKAPAWLLDAISKREPKENARPDVGPVLGLAFKGVREGARNESLTRVVGYLVGRRVDPRLALLLCYCLNRIQFHPPLPTEEVLSVVHSISGREAVRRRGRHV
ncbi:MAG: bifunctional DNA primase/polymerase [Deltaproteobacteria bacterium]